MALQINATKTWKLEELAQKSHSAQRVDTWVYYCGLCDEVLMVSRRLIAPKGVQAAFDGICPDCEFGLEEAMRCEQTQLPYTRANYINPGYLKTALLAELPLQLFQQIKPQNARLAREEQVLTTGIEKLDKLASLTTGQFVVFHGYSFSRSLAELLCVRAQLDHPTGLNSDAIFIDGGNSFDAYAVSNYAIEHRIEPKHALSRVHVSRAFTYFQLASLLTEKLPNVLARYRSRLAIVSDITELFQDPEIKDKQEAYRVFQRVLRSLSVVAEITESIVLATSFRKDIKPFDTMLMQTAHTTILAEGYGDFTRFKLAHHRSLPIRRASHRECRTDQLLEDYLRG